MEVPGVVQELPWGGLGLHPAYLLLLQLSHPIPSTSYYYYFYQPAYVDSYCSPSNSFFSAWSTPLPSTKGDKNASKSGNVVMVVTSDSL